MPTERDVFMPKLTRTDFNIAGNSISAFYDNMQQLICVLDSTVTDIKPNALLIINKTDDRKWDDVLVNDYDMDLETIRPKKDNLYQKLDIEYDGLGVYEKLINERDNPDELKNAIIYLNEFRLTAVRRAALDRLASSEVIAENAQDTINNTKEVIVSLQSEIQDLRARLASQRQDIGREPTKRSASKILRTESQIDSANEKLARAEKRIRNAEKRLAIANRDANAARAILERTQSGNIPEHNAAQIIESESEYTDPVSEPESTENQGMNDMADEEVKPLFDKDPEILDDEIAFKPVDFGMQQSADDETFMPAPQTDDDSTESEKTDTDAQNNSVDDSESIKPISFTPIADLPDTSSYNSISQDDDMDDVDETDELDITQEYEQPIVRPQPEPVAPAPLSFRTQSYDDTDSADSADDTAPVLNTMRPIDNEYKPAPDSVNVAKPVAAPTPFVPTPVSPVRPVSPITGNTVGTVQAVEQKRKPSLLYYFLLIILVVLSIFTLWLYQKSSQNNVPDIGATSEPVIQPAEPVVVPEPIPEPEPEPVITPEPEPEPVVIPEPEPEPEPAPVVTPEPEPKPLPVVSYSKPTDIAEPVVQPKPAKPVTKPTYNVSRSENIFMEPVETYAVAPTVVAEPEPVYVPEEPVYEEEFDDVQYEQSTTPTSFIGPEYALIESTPSASTKKSVIGPEYAVIQEEIPMCSDGNAPDANGCCAGEEFAILDNNSVGCCIIGTDECYPPMQ